MRVNHRRHRWHPTTRLHGVVNIWSRPERSSDPDRSARALATKHGACHERAEATR